MTSEQKKHEVWDSSLYRPQFVSSWHQYVLFDLAQWINGLAFRNIHFSATGKPIIKIAEIKNGITGQTKFTNTEFDTSYHLSKGDMLFSWSGQPETSIDTFWWDGPDGWLNQHIFKVIPQDPCYRYYFYYLLKYLKPNFVQIARNKQTTGLGHVTKKDLQNIYVSLPPIPEQKAIANILGTLDDKIELNRKMNNTLEAMARAIFKSWFVDFDPVRAKVEGRQPVGMNSETAALFPDSFEDSELGQIPKGWKVGKLGDVVELAYGKALRESNRVFGKIPVYGSNGQVGWHNEVLVNGPGIVIGRKGNPGIVTWSHSAFFPIDTTFYVVPIGEITSYCYFFHELIFQNLPALGADSAVPGLNRNIAYMNRIILPKPELVSAFDAVAHPIFAKIYASEKQNASLAATREVLLSKLLSGKIQIKDTEKFVEDVT